MMKLDSSTILNDRYRLHHRLGFGGFSQVWHAWDERSQYEVAIKVFLRQDNEGIRMCQEEFDRTNKLRHDRLIRLLDFNVHEEAPYLVMPYYHRKTLEDRIGNIDEPTLWRVMRDIASGLEYIHGLNPPMVHNDIKPDNFLIDDKNGFVLTDFGISTELADKMTRSKDFSAFSATGDDDGDPKKRPAGIAPRAYRAPELFHYRDVLKNKPIKSSDIWAFGACLHELAVGETPFGDDGGLYQLMQHKDYGKLVPELVGEPFPAHFSPQLVETVYSCLSFLTWDRPVARKLVEIADQNLARFQSGSTHHIITPPPPPNPPGPKAEPERGFKPEYNPPPSIERRSLSQRNIPTKNREMPIWLWIVILIALAVGVFFALDHLFGTKPKIYDQEGKPIGMLDDPSRNTKATAPGSGGDSTTSKNNHPSPKGRKKKQENADPVPVKGTDLTSKGYIGPTLTENLGTPSSRSGYHLVIRKKFSRDDVKEKIKILKEAFPDKNIWATELEWGTFEIKLGSFSSEKKAQEFQGKLSKELGISTALNIRPN